MKRKKQESSGLGEEGGHVKKNACNSRRYSATTDHATPHNPAYIPQASSTSSRRQQACDIASEVNTSKLPYKARRKAKRRGLLKAKKLMKVLLNVSCPDSVLRLTREHVQKNFVVFDGGDDDNAPIDPTLPNGSKDKPLEIVSVRTQMHVPKHHLEHPSLGLTLRFGRDAATLVLAPILSVKEHTSWFNKSVTTNICDALDVVAANTRKTNSRGGDIAIIHDPQDTSKYCCTGPQPRRAGTGVEPIHYPTRSLTKEQCNTLSGMFRQVEVLFKQYIDTNQVRRILQAIDLVDAQTFSLPEKEVASDIFAAFAHGINVYLNGHRDKDMTYGAVFIHMRELYKLKNRIVAYFCFPRLGISIPLRPGDVLFFNPREEHCVSSRCNNSDTIYCVSLYLKSSLFGLNNNGMPLLPIEERLAAAYKNKYSK